MPTSILRFPTPHRISVRKGARASDADHTRIMVNLAFDIFVSVLNGYIDNLRENVPHNFNDMAYEYALIADARKSMSDTLLALEDRLAEEG